MTNLVPVFIDKDTGQLVGSDASTQGITLTQGFLFTQSAPASPWIVVHNRDTRNVLVQIYDADFEKVIPDKIKIFNLTTVRVEFATPQDGFALLTFFKV